MKWKKLLFPPLWLNVLLAVFCTAALVYVFVNELDESWMAYGVYALSSYALCVLCIACWKAIPAAYRHIRERLYANKHARRYFTDVSFKTRVALYRSLSLNLLYSLANGIFAKLYNTHWFAIFALYYAILAVMRFVLLSYVNQNDIGLSRIQELRCSRLCSYILLSVNLALSGAVLMMVSFQRGFEYPGVLIYLVALYAFYTTITAIIELVKYRKYNSPVMSASKIIKLAAALVSMLSLETAMFAQFGGEMSAEVQKPMLILTGAGVSAAVFAMALYMIVRTTKEIKRSLEING